MAKSYEAYTHPKLNYEFNVYKYDATQLINHMDKLLAEAKLSGWESLYFSTDGEYMSLMGVKPPDQEEIRKAKERRRKQYERLKKEFEG